MTDTRTRTLDAAERLFEAHGVEGTSLAAIAKAVGIRGPSILHHFASKEALLAEVIARLLRRGRDQVYEALLAHDSAAERFEAVVVVTRTLYHRYPRLIALTLSELLRPEGVAHAEVEAIVTPMLEKVERSFRGAAGLPPGAPIRTTRLTVVVANLVRLSMGDLGRRLRGSDAEANELLRVLFRGLDVPAAPRARRPSTLRRQPARSRRPRARRGR